MKTLTIRKVLFLMSVSLITFNTISYGQAAQYTYSVKTLKTPLNAENLYEPYFVKHVYPKQKFIRKTEMDYSDRGYGKGLSYSYTKSTKGHFLKQIYYANGQLSSEMYQNLLSSNMEGYENTYYENGQLKSSVSRISGVYAGLKIELHENGKLAGRGMYLGELEDGQKKGHWSYFYDNGQLKETGSYQNNFSKNNRLKFSSKTGEWNYYNENGELVKTEG